VAGLDFGVGDGAVGLNLDKQHDLATYMHAVSDFGIDRWDTGDDNTMDVAGEGCARAEGETTYANERTSSAKWTSQLKPPQGTEAVSADAAEALTGGEGGSEDLGEGEVFGGATGALLPIEEELAIAVGKAGVRIDVEFGQGAIDPVRRAFEFGVISDGGFVNDKVGYGVGDGIDVGPLGAEFFVDEGGCVTERLKDGSEGRTVFDCSLGFDADFVACDVGRLVARALVSEDPDGAVAAKAKKLTFGAEIAGGGVVKGVVLEGARSVEVEAELRKAGLKGGWVGDGEFKFDLGCLHGVSIRLIRAPTAIGWRDMFSGKTERLQGEAGVLRAAELVRAGGTVAFPTETVYGLGANALDSTAVGKIFAAKERPGWDPVIVHVCDHRMVGRVASIEPGQATKIEALMTAFWPGPLTLLLPRTAAVPDSVTAGRPLVGVRMPAHPVALELIRRAGVPVAAPSANRFGRTSPTTAAHVLEDLDGRIDAVLDGGATSVGVESTVLDVGAMMIYRPGAVTAEMIAAIVGEVQVFQPQDVDAAKAPESLPSPGVGLRHYAPRARLVLVEASTESALAEAVERFGESGEMVGVMLPDGWNVSGSARVFEWGLWGDKEMLARRLFAGLRALDEAGVGVIICPLPEGDGVAVALRDRLRKAARVK